MVWIMVNNGWLIWLMINLMVNDGDHGWYMGNIWLYMVNFHLMMVIDKPLANDCYSWLVHGSLMSTMVNGYQERLIVLNG